MPAMACLPPWQLAQYFLRRGTTSPENAAAEALLSFPDPSAFLGAPLRASPPAPAAEAAIQVTSVSVTTGIVVRIPINAMRFSPRSSSLPTTSGWGRRFQYRRDGFTAETQGTGDGGGFGRDYGGGVDRITGLGGIGGRGGSLLTKVPSLRGTFFAPWQSRPGTDHAWRRSTNPGRCSTFGIATPPRERVRGSLGAVGGSQ
ncbi:MAG: hypothetical protein K0Q72_4876 [Armatimonadetes bacterium]|nr:hypothetical protein [Armatimonadota bacterium]